MVGEGSEFDTVCSCQAQVRVFNSQSCQEFEQSGGVKDSLLDGRYKEMHKKVVKHVYSTQPSDLTRYTSV